MIKVLENKNIYIDIDGTLSEYRFNNHVSAKDGTTNGQTMEEIENHIFSYSRPLKSVIKTLTKVSKKKDTNIWICGAIISPVELFDKIKWLDIYCKNIRFNGYFWYVPEKYWNTFIQYFNKESNLYAKVLNIKLDELDEIVCEYGLITKGNKTQIWDWIANHNFSSLDKSVFIDDVLSYLKYAEQKGVTAYHISSFIK